MTEDQKQMTTTTGMPVTGEWARGEHDELARNVVRNEAARRIGSALDGTAYTEDSEVIDALADSEAYAYRVAWERAVNGAGVPVRRAVLRSAWEVDPEGVREPDGPVVPGISPAPFVEVTVQSSGMTHNVGTRVVPGQDVVATIEVRDDSGRIAKLPMTVRIRP